MGQLSRLAKLATEASLDRKLMGSLKASRVGTKNIEIEALKLASQARKGRGELGKGGKKSNAFIKEHREESKVMDLVDLKIKYASKQEKERKDEYREAKRTAKTTFE